jgi:hypothetical protein
VRTPMLQQEKESLNCAVNSVQQTDKMRFLNTFSSMPTTDSTLGLQFPDWPDLPPPQVPNEEYLAWLRETWSWMKGTPQWEKLMKHETESVEIPFSLP